MSVIQQKSLCVSEPVGLIWEYSNAESGSSGAIVSPVIKRHKMHANRIIVQYRVKNKTFRHSQKVTNISNRVQTFRQFPKRNNKPVFYHAPLTLSIQHLRLLIREHPNQHLGARNAPWSQRNNDATWKKANFGRRRQAVGTHQKRTL